jgi:deoxyhypusine synthase
VATVEVGFVEAITPNLVRTVTQVALEQGATSVVVNTGPVVNIDLAISLGPASETGATVLSGEVVLVEGGLAPIFEIFISPL